MKWSKLELYWSIQDIILQLGFKPAYQVCTATLHQLGVSTKSITSFSKKLDLLILTSSKSCTCTILIPHLTANAIHSQNSELFRPILWNNWTIRKQILERELFCIIIWQSVPLGFFVRIAEFELVNCPSSDPRKRNSEIVEKLKSKTISYTSRDPTTVGILAPHTRF